MFDDVCIRCQANIPFSGLESSSSLLFDYAVPQSTLAMYAILKVSADALKQSVEFNCLCAWIYFSV